MIDDVSWPELLVSGLIVLGSTFALIGSWGLARLPSLMERLHAPTMATTLGLGALLAGSMVWFPLVEAKWTTHELLITLFLFITAPVTANMIAKVHLHRLRLGETDAPPGPAGRPVPPPGKADWASHEAPHLGTPGDFAGD